MVRRSPALQPAALPAALINPPSLAQGCSCVALGAPGRLWLLLHPGSIDYILESLLLSHHLPKKQSYNESESITIDLLKTSLNCWTLQDDFQARIA